MEAIIRQQSIKQDMMILLVAMAMAITFIGYRSTTGPHYLPTSKIEEGTVVVRNDSVTTIVIPDRR